MLAVGPLGPQYCWLFAWYELGRQAHLGVDTLPSQRVPQKILKTNISLYYILTYTLILELTAEQPEYEVRKARVMVQFLINGYGTIEYSTSQIMKLFNSSPQDQPQLSPFLKLSSPPLQQSLATGELAITGTLPPVHLLKKDVKKPPPLSMPTI